MKTMSKRNKIMLLVFIVLFFVGLLLLILTGIIDFDDKFYVLTIGVAFAYIVLRVAGFSNSELGITRNDIKTSILQVGPITIILAIIGLFILISGFSWVIPNEKWGFLYFIYLFHLLHKNFFIEEALKLY